MKLPFFRCFFIGIALSAILLNSAHALYYDFEKGDQGWQQINGNGVMTNSKAARLVSEPIVPSPILIMF